MEKIKLIFVSALVSISLIFISCNNDSSPLSTGDKQVDDSGNTGNTGNDENSDSEDAGVNSGSHEDQSDYTWDISKAIQIVLNGNSITVNGAGAIADGSTVTISSAGTYSIKGSLSDGQIIVDTKDEDVVRIILNGADISCSTNSPVFIKNAEKTIIVLADNTKNSVKDGSSYIFNDTEDEPNAVIFSKSNLTIYGNGSLTVNGNYNDGIACKDGLIIKSGAISVSAKDDGIRGKDYLIVKDGDIIVNAGGDGLKSDNTDDTTMGYISIETGTFNITSAGDALAAETDVLITDGNFILSSGGGSNKNVSGDISAKGIKGVVSVIIDGGDFSINSADDALHSNGNLKINSGTYAISAGDDGIHADSSIEINGGVIGISKSYEGIESAIITINDGDIHISSSDDGINGAGGNDGSGMQGWGGQDASSGNNCLYINGGYIVVDGNGDGIDINGSIVMTGGDVIVNGPTENMNGALDYDASFKITGGFLVAAGSSGMAQIPGATSTQCSVLLNFRSSLQAGTLFNIQNSDGKSILSFVPTKRFQSIAFSSTELIKGSTYNVYYGGSSTGTFKDGLCLDGTYSPGTKLTSFTVTGVVTNAAR